MTIDLHAHSTASDGVLTPAEVVSRAAARGVGTLALTDHDTIDGVGEAMAAGAVHGVRVIPGVEFSTGTSFGRNMHLVALFADPDVPGLAEAVAENRDRRAARVRRIITKLADLDVVVTEAQVRAHASGRVGSVHIAAALVDAGYCSSRKDAMDRYLGDGRPASTIHQGLDAVDAVRLVRRLGGAPIVAHPGTLRLGYRGLESFVQSLAAAGLVGIEVHRPEHVPGQRTALGRIAKRLRLVPCGGSDFHSPDGRFDLGDTGAPPLPGDTAERVLDAVGKRVPSGR